jgi:glutamine amidotransferase
MIAILDYESGNQTSVKRALAFQNIEAVITADADVIGRADGLIFPGVGAAGQAMGQLRKTGLDVFLRGWVAQNRPLLGVCLGCQVLLDYSEENATQTLGILPGKTRLFEASLKEEDGRPIRIPHMGWNAVHQEKDCLLFEGIAQDAAFYFVHGYYPDPAPECVLATTYYGKSFCSVLGRQNLWATQFHVEKSGPAGLRLLANFCSYCNSL